MKIHFDTSVGKAASKFPGRYVLQAVELTRAPGPDAPTFATASDGRIMAIRRVGLDGNLNDNGNRQTVIPAAAAVVGDVERGGDGTYAIQNGKRAPKLVPGDVPDGNFPDFGAIIPDPVNVAAWVTVNADLLHKLATAMARDADDKTDKIVSIGITAPGKAVILRSGDGNGLGLLMPVDLDAGGLKTDLPAAVDKFADEFKASRAK